MQDKVFDRFFKVSSSYKSLYNGHGLGLHIAQSYVGLLGGHITLTSKEGVGSTFHFDLECRLGKPIPQENQIEEEVSAHCDSIQHLKTIHILLVEDNVIALKTLESLLTQKNYKLYPTRSAEEALELLQHQSVDLIITDIGLPGISGTEFTKAIRNQEYKTNRNLLPIIGLSGHSKEAAFDECKACGMNEILTKPVATKILRSLINKFTQDKDPLQEQAPSQPSTKYIGLDLPDNEEALFELEHLPLFDEKLALQQINNKELMISLLRTYLSEAIQHDIALLKEAYVHQNWQEIVKIAHKIKGGLSYIGTQKMNFSCQYLERYYNAGRRNCLDKLYHQLIKVNEETMEALAKWLNDSK